MVPYHCLGGIWSQRDKKGKEHLAPTIRATVAQFNSVTNCVITTCLSNPTLKPNQRARLLERWIDVARVSSHARLLGALAGFTGEVVLLTNKLVPVAL